MWTILIDCQTVGTFQGPEEETHEGAPGTGWRGYICSAGLLFLCAQKDAGNQIVDCIAVPLQCLGLRFIYRRNRAEEVLFVILKS